MWGIRLIYVLLLGGSGAFYIFYTGWVSGFLLVSVLVLPVFSLAVSLPAILHFRLELTAPARCEMLAGGGSVRASVRAQAGRMLPPPYRCRLRCVKQMTGAGFSSKLKNAGHGAAGVPVPAEHCGAWEITVIRARVCDYLGLFSFGVRAPEKRTVTVLPIPVQPEPVPDLSALRAVRFVPKSGGGFAEVHDLRAYRPGDSLRDIHWKLTAKTDEPVVREAMVPEQGRALVTFDLYGTESSLDETLGKLLWVSERLLKAQIPFEIGWLEPGTLRVMRAGVDSEEQLQSFLDTVLSTPLSREAMPSMLAQRLGSYGWRYHVSSGETEVQTQ